MWQFASASVGVPLPDCPTGLCPWWTGDFLSQNPSVVPLWKIAESATVDLIGVTAIQPCRWPCPPIFRPESPLCEYLGYYAVSIGMQMNSISDIECRRRSKYWSSHFQFSFKWSFCKQLKLWSNPYIIYETTDILCVYWTAMEKIT